MADEMDEAMRPVFEAALVRWRKSPDWTSHPRDALRFGLLAGVEHAQSEESLDLLLRVSMNIETQRDRLLAAAQQVLVHYCNKMLRLRGPRARPAWEALAAVVKEADE